MIHFNNFFGNSNFLNDLREGGFQRICVTKSQVSTKLKFDWIVISNSTLNSCVTPRKMPITVMTLNMFFVFHTYSQVWTIAVMLLSGKFKRLPHLFALNLFLAQVILKHKLAKYCFFELCFVIWSRLSSFQFLVCVSMILWNFLAKQQDNLAGKMLAFALLYGSLYSTYIWTGECARLHFDALCPNLHANHEPHLSSTRLLGLIPLCLALTSRDDLLRLRPAIFMILGWGWVPQ